MILVYQMGKVASQSWCQAIWNLDPAGEPPAHLHHLAPAPRARVARILDLPAPYQTIANRVMPRHQQRNGAAILAQIEACRGRGETIRVVTGIRDPLPRSISSLLFLADFYDHTSRPLSARNGATPAYMSDALREIWASVFTDAEPECSFEWVARDGIGLYRTWFADELETVFGVDVFSVPFPAGGGAQRLNTPGVEVLVYRVEDMAATSPAHGELLAAASAFLGAPVTVFPETNTVAARRSHPLSDYLRANFRLPADLIETIYDDPTIRHFYSPGEIAAFKARWREGAAGA
ncbi:MAG: putative capsular polysaccharide synthesis family protein [Caulobacteraceae bacterium]